MFTHPSFLEVYQSTRSPLLYLLSTPSLVQGLDLPINTFSCTVGLKLSQANYYIKSSLAAAALCKEASPCFTCALLLVLLSCACRAREACAVVASESAVLFVGHERGGLLVCVFFFSVLRHEVL